MPITSGTLTNPRAERIKRVAALADRKARERAGKFLIEGPQCVREAVRYRPDAVSDVYVGLDERTGASMVDVDLMRDIARLGRGDGVYVHYANADVMARMSADCQGVLAVGEAAALRADAQTLLTRTNPGDMVAAFWQVRDPGNAGTVIRVSDAAGCAAVVLVDDCVDPYNPKVMRSTTGSLFHVPVLSMSTEEWCTWCRTRGLALYAADVYGTPQRPVESLPLVLSDRAAVAEPKAVLFGNEARGLPQELLEAMDRIVSIPLYGQAESLNLATSAAVMLMGLAMSSHIGTM